MPKFKKFSLLASLYIAQGLPYGFFTQALPSLLREQGISLQTIGLGSLLAIPWALKWLYAPLLDKNRAYRKWIIMASIVSVLTCIVLSTLQLKQLVNEQIWILYLGFFLLNLTAATQDIATDAIAVIQLSESERGFGNGIQVAGYRVGMILSGGALLAWFSQLGWQSSILILAGLIFLSSLPILFIKPILLENDKINESNFKKEEVFWLISNNKNRLWIITLCLYKFGDALATPMLRPMLVDFGYSLEDLAYLLGSIGFTTGLLGSIVGGFAINLLGHRLTLRLFLLLNGVSVLSYVLIAMGQTSHLLVQVICGIEHFTGGMATVALFTEMMYHCRSNHEATDYTLQACIVVFVNIIASAISGFIAQRFGYSLLFLVCAIFCFSVFPILILYQNKRQTTF